MNKNSENNDILYDIIGEFEDELIEKAADYKKSSRVLAFPIYKYVNLAAAFLICIVLSVVFVQLKPINEIDETLIIPTNQPKATDTPIPTEEPEETASPTEDNAIIPSDIMENVATETPLETFKPLITKAPAVIIVPTNYPRVTTRPTINPVIVKPTLLPVRTAKPAEVPVRTAVPTREPTKTEAPQKTLEPTSEPNEVVKPTVVPTLVPTETPIIRPTGTPIIEPTGTPVIRPTGTPEITPMITPEITPMVTPEITPTPTPMGAPPKTNTPTEIPTRVPTATPTIQYGPTATPAYGPTPTPTVRPTPTPAPTAPPLNLEDCTSIEGESIVIKDTNGAEYDETSEIIKLTESLYEYRNGVEIVNPIAGNENMISDYGYLMDVETNGLLNAFHLKGSKLGWGTDREKLPVPDEQEIKVIDLRIKSLMETDISKVYYPKPESKVGFSMSFWAKTTQSKENGVAVAFVNENQCIAVSINGNVDYVDVEESKNQFTADSYKYCESGEWHYYTITFANDWITYYVDGVEVPYSKVQLNSIYIGMFNDGFLTRYNPAVTWTEEDYTSDWRCYLRNQRYNYNDILITEMKYTLMNGSRYRGIRNSKKLLLDFMSSEETRVVLGGGSLGYNHVVAGDYMARGTEFAQVKYYTVELTNKNVYANYNEALKAKPE